MVKAKFVFSSGKELSGAISMNSHDLISKIIVALNNSPQATIEAKFNHHHYVMSTGKLEYVALEEDDDC